MNTVTFEGNLLHLEGSLPDVGKPAPNFVMLATDLTPRSLGNYLGKTLVIASVPSLDTPVCDLEIRRFNDEATKLSDKVIIAAASCDLPFAQARWCGAQNITNVTALSDHKDTDFGRNYGVLIRELRLLARAVFVINPQGTLVYMQLVPEITNQPDYAPVLEAIKKTL